MRDEIARRLAEVRERIAGAAERSERRADAITLVLASKTQGVEAIRAAYAAGARDFGENYVKEAIAKRGALKDLADARWHLIGHLQTNKARLAAANFDLIQSLDSIRLGLALVRLQGSPKVRTLIEVNLGGEASKSGCTPDESETLIDRLRGELEIEGLMTIPPPSPNPTDARPYFARLRELRDGLARSCGLALSELSMGMSGDFEVAIAEGATIVRVGRAVFGERRG